MRERLRAEIRGAVQGVGFRPFVYRLARELGLDGWVVNDGRGVIVEVEGRRAALERFLERLAAERPDPASIESIETRWLEPAGLAGFRIARSDERGEKSVQLLPDLATCSDCLGEVLDPANRRAGYPFTNCTRCGPRFTIVRALPYDRPRTTMEGFRMCAACAAEYDDPADRRFHAQPNACPACGPALALWDAAGAPLAAGAAALAGAAAALAAGEIVAVKGLGGFHLMVDARDGDAIARLRQRKVRREKPLALLVRDLEQAAELCELDDVAARALAGTEAPIVLLPRRAAAAVHESVAPGNTRLGIMLPCMPLHHLLMRAVTGPLVATSGNLGEEPICTDEREAVVRLRGIADRYLVHDRPIARHADDSVAFTLRGEARLVRRARGFAPRPVLVGRALPVLLAVGAHLKNVVALAIGRQVFLSQHIGDMETPESQAAFERVVADLLELYEATPEALVHDLHPDYVTTRWARDAVDPARHGHLAGLPLVAVQHHHAHLAACLAENAPHERALGVTWDGTGFGTDGTVWGGEFLAGGAAGFRRVAHLRPFRLPGGDRAVREPRRSALALLWELEGPGALGRDDLEPVRAFSAPERGLLGRMLATGLNAPVTTSAGRLFDGIAALTGLHPHATFEGQAAMALEHAADADVRDAYPIEIVAGVLDWRPLVAAVVEEVLRGTPRSVVAARFHNALAEAIVAVARDVGEPAVALSGGCFQNRLLAARAAERLESAGFVVLLHRAVPPNDGGICLGQVAVAAAAIMAAGRRS